MQKYVYTRCRAFNPSRLNRRARITDKPELSTTNEVSIKQRLMVQRSATVPTINVTTPAINANKLPNINKPQRTYSFKPKRLRLEPLFIIHLPNFVSITLFVFFFITFYVWLTIK